jgi:CTP synthase (UTP-ammonia lyase)
VKKEDERKFIFIIGGSLSGIGKATLAGSIGVLIKEGGIGVQMVKLEA